MNQMLGSRLIDFLNSKLEHGFRAFHIAGAGRYRSSGHPDFFHGRAQSRPFISVFYAATLHFAKGAFGTVCIRH